MVMKKIVNTGVILLIVIFSIKCSKEDEVPKEPNTKPTIEFITPSDSSIFIDGQLVDVEVEVSDEDGFVSNVIMLVNGFEHSYFSKPPYKITWDTSLDSAGWHILDVMAYDDDNELTYSWISVKTLPGSAPIAKYEISKTEAYVGDTVHFTDLSENIPRYWFWEFGDYSSTDQNPSFVCEYAGKYEIYLQVNNKYGYDIIDNGDYILVHDK